jgi:hypothetical protein
VAGVEALQNSGRYKEALHLKLATMRYTGSSGRATRDVVLTATAWLGVRSYIEARKQCLHITTRELSQIARFKFSDRSLSSSDPCCWERPFIITSCVFAGSRTSSEIESLMRRTLPHTDYSNDLGIRSSVRIIVIPSLLKPISMANRKFCPPDLRRVAGPAKALKLMRSRHEITCSRPNCRPH